MLIAILGWAFILHYLDDFFAILSLSADATAYSQQFDNLCVELGLLVNHSKDAIGTTADFLGIEFDSNLIQARLSPDKLARARNTAKDLLNRTSVSHQELDSVIGFLLFASKVVVPGRAFLRRLYDALSRLIRRYIITSDIKADLH